MTLTETTGASMIKREFKKYIDQPRTSVFLLYICHK